MPGIVRNLCLQITFPQESVSSQQAQFLSNIVAVLEHFSNLEFLGIDTTADYRPIDHEAFRNLLENYPFANAARRATSEWSMFSIKKYVQRTTFKKLNYLHANGVAWKWNEGKNEWDYEKDRRGCISPFTRFRVLETRRAQVECIKQRMRDNKAKKKQKNP